jgi:hypothetical protein
LEKVLLGRLLVTKIKESGFKGLGTYNSMLEKLTEKDLERVLENIKYASTDIQVTIDNENFIVEVMTCDDEIDFDVLSKDVYMKRYGIDDDTYNSKFNEL